MALIHSILIGAVAGMRALTPLAAVSHAARTHALPAGNGAAALLGRPLVSAGALALAAGELAGDKMASAPSRTGFAGMAARVASGAIAGAALAPRRQRILAALLGAGAAAGAAYLSHGLRTRSMRRHGQTSTGLFEDTIALGSAALITRSAAGQ